MAEVRRQVRIDAPFTEVFAYVDRPVLRPEFTPDLVRPETVEELERGYELPTPTR